MCKLSTESSLRRCRTPDGKVCSGRGKCDCGICLCEATEPGKFYGPRCECHDWVCTTYNGKTCNGAYIDFCTDTWHRSESDMLACCLIKGCLYRHISALILNHLVMVVSDGSVSDAAELLTAGLHQRGSPADV